MDVSERLRALCLLTAWIMLPFQLLAQPFARIERQMNLYHYTRAIHLLNRIVDKDKYRDQAIPLIAECYKMQNEPAKARVWYDKATRLPGAKPDYFFCYAQILRTTGEYANARDIFEKYSQLCPEDNCGALYASFCDSVLTSWKYREPTCEIKWVNSLNTPESDFGSAIYKGQLIFTSDRKTEPESKTYNWTGRGFLNIFQSSPETLGDFWGNMNTPIEFHGGANQSFHDGPATFLGDSIMFITRSCHDKARKSNKVRTNYLKIFYSTKNKSIWTEFKPFFLNNPDYSVAHLTISPDGCVICFASDMPGGIGESDLWMCSKKGDVWSEPKNLGPGINTSGNEVFPVIQENGSLTFASDGHPGFGSLDIYQALKIDTGWANPTNLGFPINSSYDDFELIYAPGGRNGFFSSNRPGGSGSDDIYAFREFNDLNSTTLKHVESPKPYLVKGIVKDKTTLEPLGEATVFILNNTSKTVKILKTKQDGTFIVQVDRPEQLTIRALKLNYIADCLPLTIKEIRAGLISPLPRELLLDKLEIHKSYKIENIYYNYDKSEIREDAKPELDKLVQIMKENAINVELRSHTDSRGSKEYNDNLSQNRAQAAVDYIISQGIDASRIIARGYGERSLVNRCADGIPCTEEEHQANRRTEFNVIGISSRTNQDQFDPRLFIDGLELELNRLPVGFFDICE